MKTINTSLYLKDKKLKEIILPEGDTTKITLLNGKTSSHLVSTTVTPKTDYNDVGYETVFDMKNTFSVSLCKNGLLGGWITIGEISMIYKTGKMTIPEKYRNLVIEYK